MTNMECQEISAGQLKHALLSGTQAQLVDVREIDEYRSGHIEGATLIPLGVLPYRLDEVHRDRETIVICRSGNRSKQACQILKDHGYSNVKSLRGGLSSWNA